MPRLRLGKLLRGSGRDLREKGIDQRGRTSSGIAYGVESWARSPKALKWMHHGTEGLVGESADVQKRKRDRPRTGGGEQC